MADIGGGGMEDGVQPAWRGWWQRSMERVAAGAREVVEENA